LCVVPSASAARLIGGSDREPVPLAPWDTRPSALLGVDNTLALAKLRIELERALREVAFRNGVPVVVAGGTPPLGSLVGTLAQRQAIPADILPSLREVLSVCNQAVHGAQVPADAATAIVSFGERLLRILADLPRPPIDVAVARPMVGLE
jgi:hypothetical protein